MLDLAQALLVILCWSSSVFSFSYFLRPNVTFNHMAYDPGSGSIYVGAVNWIFQLSPNLQLLAEDSTGPVFDFPDCLPFKYNRDCPQAAPTQNTNKLLTVNTHSGELLTCGHVFQGICEKRSLANISNVIYQTVDPGDNQFVAANDPKVTTVGIVERTSQGHDYLFVGRGLTARLSSGIPPITIRQLDKPSVFSNEGLGKLVVGDFSDYNNMFISVFSNHGHVYFLFYRRGSKSQMDYKTYLGSVCSQDLHLYSYVEVPLVCEGGFNLAQAAHLEIKNQELFVVFAASQGSSPNPSGRTALCSYRMEDIKERITNARVRCYTNFGKGTNDQEEAGIEYGVNSRCGALPAESPQNFPCGGDHTPSPIASRVPVIASPLLSNGPSLTAVAALAVDSDTVVFLGDAGGYIHKVFVSSGSGRNYSTLAVTPGSPVSPDLVLDRDEKNLYVMTESQVSKLPVAECSLSTSCDECIRAKDPFCGWCVLQGRCTEKQQCENSDKDNHWLWSFDDQLQCLSIQNVSPANQSRQEQTEILMTVPHLPAVAEDDSWKCVFNESSSPAHVYGNQVRCSSPPPEELLPNPQGKDHITIRLQLVFQDITVAKTDFTFYDCTAVMDLAVSSPCSACVSSPWRCHWCLSDRVCTHTAQCSQTTIIYSQSDVDKELSGPDSCPRMERVKGSHLFPVGLERELDLIGRNLHLLNGEALEYRCIIEVEGSPITLRAQVEKVSGEQDLYSVHCETHKYEYPLHVFEQPVTVYVTKGDVYRVDNMDDMKVTLYSCSVGQSDCSRCQALDPEYMCLWCGEEDKASCVHKEQCEQSTIDVCPTPHIYSFFPSTGIIDGGTIITITGQNMGQKAEDISVTVCEQPCTVLPHLYVVSNRIVCSLSASQGVESGNVKVYVNGREPGVSTQLFYYQDPEPHSLTPVRGPMAGGTTIIISGDKLSTGDRITVTVGDLPCEVSGNVTDGQISCITSPSPEQEEVSVLVFYGAVKRSLEGTLYNYTENPTISSAFPTKAFYGGGRRITVTGSNLDVIQTPHMTVLFKSPPQDLQNGDGQRRRRRKRRRRELGDHIVREISEQCHHNSSTTMQCLSPTVPEDADVVDVFFVLDNVRIPFSSLGESFTYLKNPTLKPLNRDNPNKPYSLKPGNVLDIEGEGLDAGIQKEEVRAMIGNGVCMVKTLTHNHLYCEPPHTAPQPLDANAPLPQFVIHMGNLRFNLGQVKYDVEGHSAFPKEAKIGLGVGAALLVPVVLIIIFMYRRQSKMAMRDYKKVLVQLENLETSVGDQCRKEFTDLMTEMMDLTSDIEGSGIPYRDYKTYIEKIFFPGDTISPLRKNLDVPENRRTTVEQGLTQLSNLLNNKLFLTKLIETLDAQSTLSQRDRCHAASLLTVALHGKLEYLTDVMKTLLCELVEQCVAKNPKLLLRRTETIVEKLLTNWMSICLHSFLREAAAEPLYMLYSAIKYQVDKGPVDAVTGKAKRTLNDARLLREDIEYRPMTLTVIVKNGAEVQRVPVRVLDTDTITQVKGKILNHVYKGTPFSLRPAAHTLDLEWRAGQAGHLTLSDEDLTSQVHDQWKRLNTLHHYKVPDLATVALIPRLHNNQCETPNNSFLSGEKTPMLEDGEDGGIRMWHLVKSMEEPEPCRRRSSLRERERAKAIPEIYLTRLLSMKGTLQKFVDDTFQAMLGVNRPVPIAIKYIFDFLDDMAEKHTIEDAETVHIWKTHSLMQRFWVLILKNPQMVFDIEVSENVDSILTVIAQTFIDSCTISEHKVGRDSPVNKLLYAREIPRYKQMVEKYYNDIRQATPASYQEMNSSLTELSGIHAADFNSLVALQELYNYINKYYDQISTALEEDPNGQKMQLAYRLQQISALVENKVTDL